MARPTDHPAGEEKATESSAAGKPALRKVTMIDPGFRQEQESSVLRPRILGMNKPADPNDRRNLRLLGIALLVAVMIFAILEYRQFRETSREPNPSSMGFMGEK
jgi:hypothetical protein